MRPDDVGLGGFDSHALPPRRTGRIGVFRALLSMLCAAWSLSATVPLAAQVQASARAGVAAQADTGRAPITPKRAFLYSLVVPGLGQATLGRPIVGAGFFLAEALAIALVHRTADDLRLARTFRHDSIPLRYAVDQATGIAQRDGLGKPVVAAWAPGYYTDALVRARRLQLEDWSAVLVFNHLIAGAEAYVAAQLWDLPQHVKLRANPVRGGFALTANIRTP